MSLSEALALSAAALPIEALEFMQMATAKIAEVLGFPCEVVSARFGAHPFERHFHDTFSIGLVSSGANVFSYRGKRVRVSAGSICIADPGEVHDGGLAGAPWCYTNIFVPPGLLSALSREDGEDADPVFEQGKVTDRVTCSLMADLFITLFASGEIQESIDDLALSAFGRLLNRHAVASKSPPLHAIKPIAQQAIEIMNDCRGSGVSLDLLARETGASRYRVIRAVSAAIGLTPAVYMLQLRVERAKKLIRTGMPLAEAAFESGFADQSHLTRAMKGRFGVTPAKLK